MVPPSMQLIGAQVIGLKKEEPNERGYKWGVLWNFKPFLSFIYSMLLV
jgi:hypothetical protein